MQHLFKINKISQSTFDPDGLGSIALCLFLPGGKSDHNSISNLAPHYWAINTTLRNIALVNEMSSQTHSQSKDLGPTCSPSAAPDKISYHILSLDEGQFSTSSCGVSPGLQSCPYSVHSALNWPVTSCVSSLPVTQISSHSATKFPPNPQGISPWQMNLGIVNLKVRVNESIAEDLATPLTSLVKYISAPPLHHEGVMAWMKGHFIAWQPQLVKNPAYNAGRPCLIPGARSIP